MSFFQWLVKVVNSYRFFLKAVLTEHQFTCFIFMYQNHLYKCINQWRGDILFLFEHVYHGQYIIIWIFIALITLLSKFLHKSSYYLPIFTSSLVLKRERKKFSTRYFVLQEIPVCLNIVTILTRFHINLYWNLSVSLEKLYNAEDFCTYMYCILYIYVLFTGICMLIVIQS